MALHQGIPRRPHGGTPPDGGGVLTIRDYRPSDEGSWLRCRVLSFLHTGYHDDVAVRKPARDVSLVAVSESVSRPGPEVVAVLDADVRGTLATIETVAVHPDHQRSGLGSALLAELIPRVRALGATRLDAWTREDPQALAWYERSGFTTGDMYLHVYATDEEADGVVTTPPGVGLVAAFLHSHLREEAAMRERFRRVYRCTQYIRDI